MTDADIPNLDAAKITSGTITQNVSAGSVAGTTGSFTNLKIYDGASEFLTMKLPSGGTGYALNWPKTVGGDGQFLRTDASGNLSWVTVSSSEVTSVAGRTGAVVLSHTDISGLGTAATLNVPATGNAAATEVVKGNDSRLTGAFQAATNLGGDLSGTLPNPVVAGIKGQSISATGSSAGQVLRYAGSGTWTPAFVSMFDLRSGVTGTQAFGGVGCLSNQTLTWTAASDNLSCTNIAIPNTQVSGLAASATTDTTNATNITSGTLNASRLPTSITNALWTDSSGNIYRSSGMVGIGTNSPAIKLDVAGAIRVGADATACAAGIAGAIRYNATNVEYCNGSSWVAFAASGAGLTSLNGLSANTQTFATPGVSGTAPNWASAGSAHTLNIPMANTASVTAGLISKAEFDTFNSKQNDLGFTPLNPNTSQSANTVYAGPSAAAGAPSFRALVAADIPSLDTSKLTSGILSIARGGTGSSTALTNNRVMISSGSKIVEHSAITASRALASDTNGLPVASATTATELGYLSGVTSSIQTQINAKASSAGWANYSAIGTNGSGAMTAISGSVVGSILQHSATGPVFSTAAYPSTTTANQLLFSSAANVVSGLPTANNAILTTNGTGVPSWSVISSDAFSQYALLAGRSGGQIFYGGNTASNNLTLDSTSDATKGNIVLAPNGGKVGIGIATPSEKLQVNDGEILIKPVSGIANNTVHTGIKFTTDNEPYFSAIRGNRDSTSMRIGMSFFTANGAAPTESMRLDYAGNLGIGTTTPGVKLDVNGSVQIGKNSATSSNVIFSPSTSNQSFMRFTSDSVANYIQSGVDSTVGSSRDLRFTPSFTTTPWFTIAGATGNVGIGTASPSAKLYVAASAVTNKHVDSQAKGGIVLEASEGRLQFIAPHAGSGGSSLLLTNAPTTGDNTHWTMNHVGPSIGDGLLFRYSRSTASDVDTFVSSGLVDALYLHESGNVAIGTTSPIRSLHVETNSGVTGVFKADTVGPHNAGNILGRTDYGFEAGSLRQVVASVAAIAGSNITSGSGKNDTVSGALGFYTTPIVSGLTNDMAVPVERVRIDKDGNVGIGTTAQTRKLDVAASVRIDSFSGTKNTDIAGLVSGSNFGGFIEGGDNGHLVFAAKDNDIDDGFVFVGGGGNYMTDSIYDKILVKIRADGRVGIGTTSPTDKLHVVGGGIRNEGTTRTGVVGEPGRWRFHDTTGYLMSFWNSSTDFDDWGLYWDTTPNRMIWRGSGADRAFVDLDDGAGYFQGSVGIGVLSPTVKLQVAGDIAPDVTASKNLGSTTLRWNNIYLSNSPDVSSDARLKKDVQTSDLGLEFVNSLRPVFWVWKNEKQGTSRHYGVIAQEAESAIAQAKGDHSENTIVSHNKETDSYSVRYTELIAPLIKAIQELHHKLVGVSHKLDQKADMNAVQAANARIQKLEAENIQLKMREAEKERELAEMKSRLEKIEKSLKMAP